MSSVLKYLSTLTAASASMILLGFSTYAMAQNKPAPKTSENQTQQTVIESIKKQLKSQGIDKVSSIKPFVITGLYEVIADKKVFYTDGKRHFIFGDVLDIQSKSNLTERARQSVNAIDWGMLNLEHALVIKQGKPTVKQSIAVFADPNCGYCKQFEETLASIKNIQVYVVPIAILGSDSAVKVESILCSTNSAKTWQDWMLKNVTPPKKTCAKGQKSMKMNQQLASKLEITGTPTMVFKGGTKLSGALNAQEVINMMNAQ